MKSWQIMSKNSGITYGIFRAITAKEALETFAKARNYETWKLFCSALNLSTTYYTDGFKIFID